MSELKPIENYSTLNIDIQIYGVLDETSINKFFPIYDNTGKKEYIYFQLLKEMTIKRL